MRLPRTPALLLAVFAVALIALGLLQRVGGGWRTDLTQDGLYTLSDGTLNTLQQLDSAVHLELFFTEEATRDIPTIRNYKRRVNDLLDEYVLQSNGALTLEVIDPTPFSQAEDRAASLGLTPAAFAPGLPAVYFGLAATGARGDTKLIPFFQPIDEATLEQDISTAVLLAGRERAPKVAIWSTLEVGGGFNAIAGRPTAPWASVQQLRELADAQLLPPDTTAIPDDVNALVVIHPNGFNEAHLYAIDQFVLRGGRLALFIDPIAESLSSQGAPAESGTTASNPATLLDTWGIEMVAGKVVADADNAIAVPTRTGNQVVRHLGLYHVNPPPSDKPIVSGLELFNFASAGALQTRDDSPFTFTPLLSSSRNSGLIDAADLLFLFDPASLYDRFTATDEAYTFAALLRGRPATAFPDGPPAGVTADHLERATDDTAIVVVSDTDFLADQMWVQLQDFFGQRIAQPFADNGAFFLNAVETLIGNTDLIALRSRGQHQRPFHVVLQLEREADQRFRSTERELTARLTETETRLAEIQRAKGGVDALVLNQEQSDTIAAFEAEKVEIRTQLRDVQRQLREDIDALEQRMKFINIVAAPLGLTLLLWFFARVYRSAARPPF